MQKALVLLSSVVWIASTCPAHAAVNWASLLDQGSGSQVRFGVALQGKEPFTRNLDEAFAPASTSKLFTAGAALARLGADYRFATTLRWNQSGKQAANVQLLGGGDPTWGMPQFGENSRTRVDKIAKALKDAGVTEVLGEPEAGQADTRWNEVEMPSGWKEQDTLSCGGSLGQGFNIQQNCATYKISGASDGGWVNAGLRWPVEHKVTEGARTSLALKLNRVAGKFRFTLSGTWKAGDAPRTFVLPVFDTLPWARALFRQALLDQGIRILPAGAFGGGGDPRGEPKALSFVSPPLSEILKPFLKNSNNYLGDALLKALAAKEANSRAPGLLEPSLAVLREFLTGLGLPRDFVLHDGSGLSRTSKCSPRMMLEFLERAQREPWFGTLWDAMAVAGVDGTLRNRMKGTAAEGQLRAKTGTIEGAYNLAGYVPNGRDKVPFVILTRTTTAHQGTARAAEDRVGAALASLHRSLFVSEELAPQAYPYYPDQAGMDDQ